MDYDKEQLIEMSVTLAEMTGEGTATIIQKKIVSSKARMMTRRQLNYMMK